MCEIDIREFMDASGRSPFARWFEALNPAAAARVTVALARLGLGNFSNVEGVGSGVYELKIDFGRPLARRGRERSERVSI